jgi:transposase
VRELLPHARLAVDHFHLILLANKAVTAVRQRVTPRPAAPPGPGCRSGMGNRRLLLRARERLSERALARMWNGCADHDPTGQILTAWIAKEELRTLCALAAGGANPVAIRPRLWAFYTSATTSAIQSAGSADT